MTQTTFGADLLAEWLETRGGEVWWFLDGEREISAELDLPAQGAALADAFRRHGGQLVALGERPGPASVKTLDELESLFEMDDDYRAIELAWMVDANPSEPWLLVESVVNVDAKELPREAWRA